MRRINRPADPGKLTDGKIVDEIGTEKAAIAERTLRERALKNELIRRGVTEAEGDHFRATVSTYERSRLDMEWARNYIGPRNLARHSTKTEETVVRVSARKRAA